MAISGGDGSIILTTKVDESGLKKGMQQANKFAQMSTNEQRRMAQSLSKVYRQQGMSQSEAQKKAWQDLKNNTVATKDLAKATEDVAKKTEQATKETKEYGDTAKRSGTIAKNTFLAVGKAFLTIGVASAAAIVAMTKQAVSAYADYEQLVGGVETLFKGSAQKVIDYANDAFYTAGVSANEYMKQVTSFSASLIRSTAGDTDKAADIANMALIDISDNVNKMGSSMESVTWAYQGFAKQQYMLLDNLKLGYGGTKTEMERLLRDAQALTGVKYDINNLADVYSAIHAIQEELGIAGTTAKEAEKTITGSANMMKAAWQNVLSAIAGGGDLDRAINNLVYSIQKYFENIVPVVQRSLVGIGRLIEQVAPMLVQNVASALIQAIPSLINAVFQMIIGLAKGIYEGIIALFTGSSGKITADIKTSVDNVSSSIGGATSGMENLGNATEAAGKKAKKSLAAFDDLQILTENAGGGSGGAGGGNSPSAGSGLGSVSSETVVTPELEQQTSIFDEILKKLQPIQEIFMSGFWEGFQNADFSNIIKSIEKIQNHIKFFAKDPELQGAIKSLGETFVFEFGKIIGAASDLGVGIAENLLEGYSDFLDENADSIKNNMTKIIFNTEGIVQEIGDFFSTIFNIISNNLKSEEAKTLTSEVLGIFSTLFFDIGALASELGKDFLSFITDPIEENKEEFQTTLNGITGIIAGFTQSIGDLLQGLVNTITNLYEQHIQPLITDIKNGISSITNKVLDAWNKHLKPVFDELVKRISSLVNEHISPMFEQIGSFVGTLIDEVILPLWNYILKPFLDWILYEFINGNIAGFGQLGDALTFFGQLISGVIKGVFQVLEGLINFVKGVFTLDWEKAWLGIKQILAGIIDIIVSLIEGVINGAVNAINSIIRGINGVIGTVGKWVGKDWTSAIPTVPTVSLTFSPPGFASGAVIPPNREFLAVLGDNKKETEIVSPVSTMKQAFTEAMIEMGGNFGGGSKEIVLEVDGREFGRAVVDLGGQENRRIGTRLVIA